jgi:hypothetical protein
MNTKDHIVSSPNGMTVAEIKRRHKRTSAEDLDRDQDLSGSVGLNTSGALAGIRASSFPNPALAPPRTLNAAKVFLEKGPLKQGQVLSAPSRTTLVGAKI